MNQDYRALLNDWVRQLSVGQDGPGLNENGIAALWSPGFPDPFHLVHLPGGGEAFVLVARIDSLGAQVTRELLLGALALNAQPALATGAFAVDPDDGTLLYRYVGELPGTDFAYFRNTVANLGGLAAQARGHYRRLRFADGAAGSHGPTTGKGSAQ